MAHKHPSIPAHFRANEGPTQSHIAYFVCKPGFGELSADRPTAGHGERQVVSIPASRTFELSPADLNAFVDRPCLDYSFLASGKPVKLTDSRGRIVLVDPCGYTYGRYVSVQA